MLTRHQKRILAQASPSIKRPELNDTTDTASFRSTGVQNTPILSKTSYTQSANPEFQYKNYYSIRPCSVLLEDVLDFENVQSHCSVSKCGIKNCKTCKILITDTKIKSNLTNRSYNIYSWDDLNCTSANLIYGLECSLCGLIYVGETKGRLNARMCGHRSGINNDSFPFVYQHFNQPDHSILSLKVRILEKIYHPTNNPTLSTPFRKEREEFWIRRLGTALPYGCNDNIGSVGNLSSPRCSDVNVMNLFEKTERRKRSHGHR